MPIPKAAGPRTPLWPELATHASRLNTVATRELFARDPGRFERFSRAGRGLLMDFSRQHLDEMVLGKLLELAEAVGLRERIGCHVARRADQPHRGPRGAARRRCGSRPGARTRAARRSSSW